MVHLEYLALGAGHVARADEYRALFVDAPSDELVAKTPGYLQQQKVLATGRFRA